jgi:hypothetical protein
MKSGALAKLWYALGATGIPAPLRIRKRKASPIQRLSAWAKAQMEKSHITSERAAMWNADSFESRTVRRYRKREESFAEMSSAYHGELRRVRRSMAFDKLRNERKGIS